MRKLGLDSILLFALVVPFIMGYRIGSGETPYLLFGGIFLLLLLYLSLDFLALRKALYEKCKLFVLWLTIVIVVGSAFVSTIIVRHQTAPVYMIHDIVLQQEAAIRFLLHGKNPYKETYFGTPLQDWHYDAKEVNPALYHFVMEPFYLLFALPFYFFSTIFFGFFDGRIPLLFLFFTLFLFASVLVKDSENKRLFLILLAFHPSLLPYTLEGRSDIFMFTFLFAGLLLLFCKRNGLAGIAIGLASAIKQSAWPLVPFYVAYLYFRSKSIKKTFVALLPFFLTLLITLAPFYLWDSKAFFESTIAYLSGNTDHSYPISGYGLGSLLLQMQVIQNKFSYYPFIIWQIIICLPLLIFLLWYLKNNLSVRTMIIVYALFLFVFWYMSRYFNNSHVAYISYVLIAAYFWPTEHLNERAK